jgi:MFS family permease
LALVCLPVFIGALDLTIVSAVLPALILDLGIPFNTGADEAAWIVSGWIVSGYLLAYTISMLFFGRVSDLIGRRRTYLIALLIFILGSWLVAVAPGAPSQVSYRIARIIQGGRPDRAFATLYALIFARVVQALGAGAMVPTSLALVADLYPPEKRATPLGVIGAVDTAGWVLGHLYGGVMVQWVEWPVLFWLNIPITTLAAILTWWVLRPVALKTGEGHLGRAAAIPLTLALIVLNLESTIEIAQAFLPSIEALQRAGEAVLSVVSGLTVAATTTVVLVATLVLVIRGSRRLEGAGRPDWVGTILIMLALLGLNLGLSAGGELTSGMSFEELAPLPPYALPTVVGAGVLLLIFVWHQWRTSDPLLNLSNFRIRNLSLSSGINLFVGFCLMVGLVSVPLFINTLVYPPPDINRAALVSGYLLGGLTIPMALAAVPGGWLTERFGYRVPTVLGLALALAGFFMARTWVPETPELTIASHMIVAGVGLGLSETPIAAALINAVKATERGMAAALVLIMRLVGMTLGTSAMTTYGLRRWTVLNRRMIAAGETDLGLVAVTTFTQTINEMLLIAAVVCLLALIPAFFFHPRDVMTEA